MLRKYSILLTLLTIFLFSECKKGENDPFVSLRTRKARVAGEWRLQEGTLTIEVTYANSTMRTKSIYDLDGSEYKLTSMNEYDTSNTTGKYNLRIGLDKKGKINVKEQVNSEEFLASGNWDFNNGIGSEKKKESLIFSIANVSSGRTDGPFLFCQAKSAFNYRIKELRNKKMVLIAEYPRYIDLTGATQLFYAELTFTQ